ncbi:DUF185-domain-containing protein [Punctularia strigosozonata HHB-11173 SS5]|uniref:DUF185-domain-containing protein n=1 Tax=Punctularia strigosozonata (strain HHB-11173) TaxID=741275 RepID=UPI0004417E07|nr:DUF185-domain-containing protein [Punctularia strigosozonata HHB-11173 SS5]EIN09977.1 DUF185-domain-containing protein [Punctularia strigosozonata HHB-11173 SS5]
MHLARAVSWRRFSRLAHQCPRLAPRVAPSLGCRRRLTTQAVTPVEKIIRDTIKATGPISFATYMQLCLSHPTEGYYMKKSNPVFGKAGDFVTSPEISQVFGELTGIWFLSQYNIAGRGRRVRLVELGPGRGTLMSDILRIFSSFPQINALLHEVHLVETSPNMRAMQKTVLEPMCRTGKEVFWHDSLDDIPHDDASYTMVIAHEFFDSLPFHLLQKTAQGWHEVHIDISRDIANQSVLNPSSAGTSALAPHLSPRLSISTPLSADGPSESPLPSTLATGQASASPLRRVLAPTPSPTATVLGGSSSRFAALPEGSQLEVSPAAFKIAHKLGQLLTSQANDKESAGCALVIDYGGDKAFGNSFRAFKNHKIVDVFHRPGECDLTVNVDFAYLKEALADAGLAHGPLPQHAFLKRMGINMRVEQLKRSAKSEERKAEIEKAARRLIDQSGMGTQYQVLGITGGNEVITGSSKDLLYYPFTDAA